MPQDSLTPTLNGDQIRQNIDALRTGGKSTSDIQSYVDNYQKSADGTYALKNAPTPTTPTAPTLGQDSMGVGNYAGGAIKSQFSSGVDQMKQSYDQSKNATDIVGKTEAGMGMLAGGVGAVTAPLAPALKPIGDIVSWLGDKIGSTKVAQDFVTQHPDAASALERMATDVGNTSTVLGTAMGGAETIRGIPETVARLSSATNDITGAIKTGVGNVKDAVTPTPTIPKTSAEIIAGKVNAVANEWKEPTIPGKVKNPASFNKANDILAKTPDTPQFLAEQKLTPANHIEDGRYATADTADALRTTAGKMSSDTLRPSLQMADYSTPKTSVVDITKDAIKNATSDTSLTPGEREAVIRNITKESAALARKYPDGMGLTDMHDNKITYSQKGGYRPDKTALDNNIASANRNLGGALGDMVEKKAPPEIPVGDFNSYLSKYYKAADYLDALNTKKAPVSLGQYLARRGAEVTGAVIGHGIGGGILGGVGGYMIGGALEHAIENMTLPMRDAFLKNLQITHPEAFTKVQNYLSLQKQGGNLPALPPATSATPIPLSAGEAPKVNVAPHAVKTLPTANPKTGRMQTTYSSSLPR